MAAKEQAKLNQNHTAKKPAASNPAKVSATGRTLNKPTPAAVEPKIWAIEDDGPKLAYHF